MSNAILSLIGLCKKAGRLEVGEEPVGAAARAHHAKLLLVAADAADNTRRRCAHFAEAGAVPWTELPFSKAELGGTVGRSSCALVAVTDIGFALPWPPSWPCWTRPGTASCPPPWTPRPRRPSSGRRSSASTRKISVRASASPGPRPQKSRKPRPPRPSPPCAPPPSPPAAQGAQG